MLRAKHDVHLGPVWHAGRQKPPKGRIRQSPLNFPAQHIDIAEKCYGGLIGGRIVDIIGRAALDDLACPHQRDFVGHSHGLFGFMGDQQHRGALFLKKIKRFVADSVPQTVVQPRKRLVHQHDPRFRGQRARQSDALLFAAGQFMRIGIDKMPQPDAVQQAECAAALFGPRTLQSKGDVLADTQMRKQGKILKHQTDFAPFRWHITVRPADHPPVDQNASAVLLFDPGNHPQRCGFAAARWAQQAGDMPRLDGQRYPIDNRLAVKETRQVAYFQPWCLHILPFGISR